MYNNTIVLIQCFTIHSDIVVMNDHIKRRKRHHKTLRIDDLDDSDDELDPRDYCRYYNTYSSLSTQGIAYALTLIIIAQVMFLNFDYKLGAIITSMSIASIAIHAVFNLVEGVYLDKNEIKKLITTMRVHRIVSGIINVSYIPFLIWSVVRMIQQETNVL